MTSAAASTARGGGGLPERRRKIDGAARPVAERRQQRGRQRHVEPEARDDVRAAVRLGFELEQDAAELALVEDEIVRPLERDREAGHARQNAAHGDADGERQRGRLRRHAGELPADRQANAAAERRAPTPAAPPAARRLEFRDADVELADGRRRGEQAPVRRIELRENLELRDPRSHVRLERRAQRIRVEQIEAARQAGSRRRGAASTSSPQSASLSTCFQIAARVTPNARASSSPECVRPSAKACNKRSTVTRVYCPRRNQRAAGLANRDSVPSSMRRMLPRCA